MNFRLKNVSGLSLDFLALNLLGWAAYATFNCVIFFIFECPRKPNRLGGAAAAAGSGAFGSKAPASIYGGGGSFLGAGPKAAELLYGGFCPYAVEVNDVAFALHALLVTLLTAAQCVAYPRAKGQRVHAAVAAGVAAAAAAAAAYGAAVAGRWSWLGPAAAPWLHWVDWLYFLAWIKMAVTLIKYIPQAALNWRRRSTRGWSILNILLDFTGGALSLGQQLLTCWATGDWAPVTSNPVKLGLALASMAFDALFMVQHYVLYSDAPPVAARRAVAAVPAAAAGASAGAALAQPLLAGAAAWEDGGGQRPDAQGQV